MENQFDSDNYHQIESKFQKFKREMFLSSFWLYKD